VSAAAGSSNEGNLEMTKYQIHGRDEMMMEDYVEPILYDTYEEAFKNAHSNREWVIKVEIDG